MNEHPHLYQRRVSPGELAEAVDALKDKLKYLYAEFEETIELAAYRLPEPASIHGRAFGPRLEVRWQRVGDGFDLLLLTEAELELPCGWQALPRDDEVLPCPDSVDPPGQVLLWGTHVSKLRYPHRLAGEKRDAWVETRIPRALEYPVTGSPERVIARIIVYRFRGRPVLTRLVDLEGGRDESRALW